MALTTRFTRIEKILDYIHANLDKSINVTEIAEQSCWSRWQLQRVFLETTGLTVAQYIRELRLSHAAEQLLSSNAKHFEIALECGFESDVSFSRAFKQLFSCSPREYRQRGQRHGLRTPLLCHTTSKSPWTPTKAFMQIRIESHNAFTLYGISTWVHGLSSSKPNFQTSVPKLWKWLENQHSLYQQSQSRLHLEENALGVVNTYDNSDYPQQVLYWAGYQSTHRDPLPFEEILEVPTQEYAVIPIHGNAQAIKEALTWFLCHWLPESNYDGVSGFELEKYEPNYDANNPDSDMEYWIPIRPHTQTA
ncbi:helix-turn-helix domain-containing protein [Marinomonas sp. 15G1-11]|uniref:Helix-turn-helix domain-containing protein n=1 Tax=Marinomonas phaeophyticola TaxID=3004091 RepID=A0ABT4JTY2_9GAMM|nr:helix-turn-helix domain-containing protein [Marinomonas sp. 15G1-11]MCZ2721853.1 helix-turn-helix domain-containing protein [Marinomonas sp. 15G1-11]